MKVAIASGKGGTGKTSVSAALVSVWDRPAVAVDLDVEEPNLHLFLNPEQQGRRTAYLETPAVDEDRCTRCRACAELCQFKAITVLGDVVMTFPEMCHGCGGCMAVCPEGAISWARRELGEIWWGETGETGFIMGRMRVGEAMSPPLMRQVKAKMADLYGSQETDPVDFIMDAPPGVSCPAVTAVSDCDGIVLVTEPTPFGLYDLRLARKAFAPLMIPMGVVVNRAGLGTDEVYGYCARNGLPILAEIPYDRKIAEAYARGEVISGADPGLRRRFLDLREAVKALGRKGTVQEAAHG